MLTHEQLNVILLKETLTFDDLYLLNHHVMSIGNLQDEYGEEMPQDVVYTLSSDLEKIISKLQLYSAKLKETRLNNVDGFRKPNYEGLKKAQNIVRKILDNDSE